MNQHVEAECIVCSQRFSTLDMIAYQSDWVCAGCKPAFFQRLQQGESVQRGFVYGTFWARFAAKFIDGVLLYLLQMPILGAAGLTGRPSSSTVPLVIIADTLVRMGLTMLVAFGVGITINVFFLGRFGATPGKMVLRLKVVRPGGEPISYLHAAGRYLAENVSILTFYIGYIMAAFDSESRALHDRIAGTRVIRVPR